MGINRTIVTAFLFCVCIYAHTEEFCPYVLLSEKETRPSVQDPWLFCHNAAGLTRFSFRNIGVAEVSLTKGKGGFTNYYDSPDALSVDASVESFFRLSPRAVVYGSMSYTNFSGHDMAGSAFIQSLISNLKTKTSNQVHLPFDIVEDSLTNTGTKHQDTYRLCGGLGIDIHKGFSLGARLDYTAANYAKYKDLRHKNKLMDLDLTAGFYLPVALTGKTTLSLGANYLYHRTTESLQFSTYGKNDKVYNSLISYANFTGHIEQFGGTGYTDKSREMPLVSDYNGIGAQANGQWSMVNGQWSMVNFFNSFTYAHRRGYYGRKSPYTITYTGHESDIYHYDASLSAIISRGSRFSLDLSLTAENLRNDAANYRELQNEQGATYYEYYTPVKSANKLWTDGTVALTADLGHSAQRFSVGSIPLWTLRAGLNWHHREQTAYLYPHYRRQDISNHEPFVYLCRNIIATSKHKKKTDTEKPTGAHPFWSLALHFSYLKGSGEPYEDLTYQQPSDKQEQPPSMDTYLWREYQWLTSSQYNIGGSVAYSFVMPGTRLRTFVRLSISHRKANETNEYTLGRDHTTASLSLGCQF